MADAGETEVRFDEDFGEVGQEDVRLILLLDLMDDGDITKAEAQDILKWSESYQDPKQIIGVLTGELGVAPKAIEGALEGTEWAIAAEDIEDTGRGFEAWKQEAATTGTGAALTMRNFMSWPTDMLDNWLQSGADTYMDATAALERNVITPAWQNTVDPARDYFMGRNREGTQIRTDVQTAVRKELDKLLKEGYIDRDTHKDLMNESGDYGAGNYQSLIDGLEAVYGRFDDATPYESSLHDNLIQALETRVEETKKPMPESTTEVTAPGDETVTNLTEEQAQAKRAQIDRERGSDVTVVGGTAGFDDYLGAAGFQDGPDEGIDYGTAPVRSRYFAEDRIYDPSTGESYTSGQWKAIKTDPRARADYLMTKQVDPAIQGLIGSGVFNLKQRLDENGKPTGEYYEPGLGSGSASLLPISNLKGAFPSPVVSNPWESSTFDYAVGQGRMEWIGLSSREHERYIKQFRNEGLISQDQFDDWMQPRISSDGWAGGYGLANIQDQSYNILAQNIYEQATSYASQFQKSPRFAISKFGQAAREYQQPRGGSGRIAPKYSVPSSLRTIPNYKALAQESKTVFNQEVGRDMEDWELSLLADEMKGHYTTRNDEMIVAHKAAWDDAVAGGSTEVDYSEVTDPTLEAQFDVQERYSDEIDRQERVEDRANSRRVLMDSITTGQRMI